MITATITVLAAGGTITAEFPTSASPNHIAVNGAGDEWIDDDGAFILWA